MDGLLCAVGILKLKHSPDGDTAGFGAAGSAPDEIAAERLLNRLPGDQVEIGGLQSGLHLLHKIRKLPGHGTAGDSLGGIDAGGDM